MRSGPFSRLIGIFAFAAEVRQRVVQIEAADADIGAPGIGERIRHADDQAVVVNDRKLRRALPFRVVHPVVIAQRGDPLLKVFLRKRGLGPEFIEIRIDQASGAALIGDGGRRLKDVEIAVGIDCGIRNIKHFRDLQHLKNGQARGRGVAAEHLPAVELRANDLADLDLIVGEVFRGQRAFFGDLLRDLTAVERIGAAGLDGTEGFRKLLLLENVTLAQIGERRIVAAKIIGEAQAVDEHIGGGEALLGIVDAGLNDVRQRHRAPELKRFFHACNDAGNRDLVCHDGRRAGAAVIVQRSCFSGLAVINEHNAASADAGGVGLAD